MADLITDVDSLKNDPNSRVIIAFNTGKKTVSEDGPSRFGNTNTSVVGFIQGDIVISGGNSYNNPLETQTQDDLTRKTQIVQAVGGSIDALKSLPISFKTYGQSVNAWTESQRPSFTIPLAFISTRPEDNVLDDIKKLNTTVFPTRGSGGTVTPPLNYLFTPNGGGGFVGGTLMIQIGRWFLANNQLMDNINFSMSRVVIKNGSPVAAVGSIPFRPFRMISADEFNNYFRV